MHAEHALAGAQRAAAQDAHPVSPAGWPQEPVHVSHPCGRGRQCAQGGVGARRRRRWRAAGRSIQRMHRVAGGCLSHGCSKGRRQPVVVNAAEDARRATGPTHHDARADPARFAVGDFPRILSGSCVTSTTAAGCPAVRAGSRASSRCYRVCRSRAGSASCSSGRCRVSAWLACPLCERARAPCGGQDRRICPRNDHGHDLVATPPVRER